MERQDILGRVRNGSRGDTSYKPASASRYCFRITYDREKRRAPWYKVQSCSAITRDSGELQDWSCHYRAMMDIGPMFYVSDKLY